MSNKQRPGRKLSPSVYRRRRIVVGIIALIVVIVVAVGITTIVRGVSGMFGSDPKSSPAAAAPTPTKTASPTKTAGASPSPTKDKVTKCAAGSIKVGADVDKTSYSGDEKPKMTLSVENISDTPCILDVGTKQLEFDITSGSDRIWSSRDCQDDSKDKDTAVNKIKFKPGDKKSASMTWNRIRSAEGCKAGLPDVKPGTYRMATKVGSHSSKGTYFTLK